MRKIDQGLAIAEGVALAVAAGAATTQLCPYDSVPEQSVWFSQA
jgi:hypothetical protein